MSAVRRIELTFPATPEQDRHEITMTSIVRVGADWTSLIEVVQEPRSEDRTWARDVVLQAEKTLAPTHGIGFTIIEHSADRASVRNVLSVIPRRSRLPSAIDGCSTLFGGEGFKTFFFPSKLATTDREIEQDLSAEVAEISRARRARHGIEGVVDVFAHPEPGIVVVLYGLHDRPITLRDRERAHLTRVAIHLETSWRKRHRPKILKAEIDATGAVGRDANHGRPLDLWPALVSGELSLAEREIDGRRCWAVVENAAQTKPFRALNEDESAIVALAATGLSTKLIAYQRGISSPRVSARLASAAAKMGIASRVELVRIAATFSRDPDERKVGPELTLAEREVLRLVQRGLSNEEIASTRRRSVRTIANQVAALLRKTNSHSRRALVVGSL